MGSRHFGHLADMEHSSSFTAGSHGLTPRLSPPCGSAASSPAAGSGYSGVYNAGQSPGTHSASLRPPTPLCKDDDTSLALRHLSPGRARRSRFAGGAGGALGLSGLGDMLPAGSPSGSFSSPLRRSVGPLGGSVSGGVGGLGPSGGSGTYDLLGGGEADGLFRLGSGSCEPRSSGGAKAISSLGALQGTLNALRLCTKPAP